LLLFQKLLVEVEVEVKKVTKRLIDKTGLRPRSQDSGTPEKKKQWHP
jgi:hypothetical protein